MKGGAAPQKRGTGRKRRVLLQLRQAVGGEATAFCSSGRARRAESRAEAGWQGGCGFVWRLVAVAAEARRALREILSRCGGGGVRRLLQRWSHRAERKPPRRAGAAAAVLGVS